MKNTILFGLILVVTMASLVGVKVRDVEAAGKVALREGLISAPSKDHDFTKIPPGDRYRPGHLLVRFAAKTSGLQRSRAEKEQVFSSLGGGTVKREFKIVPGLTLVKLREELTVEDTLKTFNKASEILYAEPDYEVEAISTFPNDPNFSELWGMHNTGQTGGTADADIDAPEAWDKTTGSNDVIVAVIDTGIDYNHPDLAANMWVNEAELNGDPNVDDDENGYIDDVYGYDFCNDDGDPMDDHFHGTHCAGTVGAVGNNNVGVVGVCWNVRLMALKFLSSGGSGYISAAIEAIEYSVDMGANLSSNSWGHYTSDPNQALKEAIKAAGEAGMLFVAAAGNWGADNDSGPAEYPASYDCNSIIAVMATDDNDCKPRWSHYGATSVDLGAPGVEILSTFPTYETDKMNDYNLSTYYETIGGTSMATPHVAGACAFLWSGYPGLSNLEVKEAIIDGVDEIAALDGLCVSDGRLNVYGAMKPSINEMQYHNSRGWVDCVEIGRILAKVKANCTDLTGYVDIVRFKLENITDNITYFDHNSTSSEGDWWIYDNNDVTLRDLVELKLTVTCVDNEGHTRVDYASWIVEGIFRIRNNSDETVAWFDKAGNLVLEGTFTSGGTCTAPADSFIVVDSADDTVAYIDNQGNGCIEGSCYELSDCNDPNEDAFINRNLSGLTMSYIDSGGDLCLRGKLYDVNDL